MGALLLYLESCFSESQAGPVGRQIGGSFWGAVYVFALFLTAVAMPSTVPGIGVPVLLDKCMLYS